MRLTIEQAAAQLADALSGAMTAAGFDGDPDYADDNLATFWFCRKALHDYSEARGDGWDPDCADDRECPSATVSYAAQLAGVRGSLGWVLNDARKQRVTHGRHCPCSACRREDWSRITAPCGMHGEDCPAVYAPIMVADGTPGSSAAHPNPGSKAPA